MLALLGIAIFGGMFVVPLYAYLTVTVAKTETGLDPRKFLYDARDNRHLLTSDPLKFEFELISDILNLAVCFVVKPLISLEF